MTPRHVRCALGAAALLLASGPGVASADPLVSGYGGPGSDQGVLGSTLLPPPGNGSSGPGQGGGAAGLRAHGPRIAVAARPASGPASTTNALGAPPLTQTPTTVGTRPAQSSAHHATRAPGGEKHPGARGSAAAPRTSTPAASPVVAPTAAGAATSAGPLPIASSDVLIALAVLAGLTVVGVSSSRLAAQEPSPT